MKPPSVRSKICGVATARDARVVRAAGADYMGVILSPGYGRSVDPSRAGEIYRAGPRARVGVFVDAGVDRVLAAAAELELDVIQLAGRESPAHVRRIGAAGPWSVWKTVRAGGASPVARQAAAYGTVADGVLVDAWDPARPGGTGRAFAWTGVGAEVRRAVGPAVLFVAAGGMSPTNARAAVETLRPDVLDVSSGVESGPGAKDPAAVRAFVAAVRGDRPLRGSVR